MPEPNPLLYSPLDSSALSIVNSLLNFLARSLTSAFEWLYCTFLSLQSFHFMEPSSCLFALMQIKSSRVPLWSEVISKASLSKIVSLQETLRRSLAMKRRPWSISTPLAILIVLLSGYSTLSCEGHYRKKSRLSALDPKSQLVQYSAVDVRSVAASVDPSSYGLLGYAPGIDHLLCCEYRKLIEGRRIALVSNCSALDSMGRPTYKRLIDEASSSSLPWRVVALFAPEHGFWGADRAGSEVADAKLSGKLPIYSLHQGIKRLKREHLKGIDLVVFDLQDVGARYYTYATTLFYLIEDLAQAGKKLVVLDRPNPMGRGIDGLTLDRDVRSFIGHAQTPTCHGLSMGELALYYNGTYQIGCELSVVPYSFMPSQGAMRDQSSHANPFCSKSPPPWIPTSPQIPSLESARGFSLVGGILSSLKWVNIGVGHTLPFQLLGAPWIDSEQLEAELSNLGQEGAIFQRWDFQPSFGLYKHEVCHGVRILVTDIDRLKPQTLQVHILDVLYRLYPKRYQQMLKDLDSDEANWIYLAKVSGLKNIKALLHKPSTMKRELLKRIDKAHKSWEIERLPYLIYP